MQVLKASVLSTASVHEAPLSLIARLFSAGLRYPDPDVKLCCREGLAVCENAIHPRRFTILQTARRERDTEQGWQRDRQEDRQQGWQRDRQEGRQQEGQEYRERWEAVMQKERCGEYTATTERQSGVVEESSIYNDPSLNTTSHGEDTGTGSSKVSGIADEQSIEMGNAEDDSHPKAAHAIYPPLSYVGAMSVTASGLAMGGEKDFTKEKGRSGEQGEQGEMFEGGADEDRAKEGRVVSGADIIAQASDDLVEWMLQDFVDD